MIKDTHKQAIIAARNRKPITNSAIDSVVVIVLILF
tara:strand:- start:653 stop:760 length:108 start_codon:yes stop_codon:yes gene_type:complete